MSILSFSIKKLALILLTVSLVAGLVWVALPTGTAAAASSQQGTTTPGTNQNKDQNNVQGAARLQRLFQQEKRVQAVQTQTLERADKVSQRVSTWIEELRGQGALTPFKASVATAPGFHEQAAGLITSHPGFDADGKVIDLALARQTVKDIRDLQVQFRQTIRPALRELIKTVREYRQNNPPAQTQQDKNP
jgi:hypothetical protein